MGRGLAGGLQRLMHFFLPKEEDFFELFVAMSRQAHEGAKLLRQVFRGEVPAAEMVEPIGELEEDVDRLRHDCVQRLNATFVTPIIFDRQDILDLSHELDNVVDETRAAIDRMALYRPVAIPAAAAEMADLLVAATEGVHAVCLQLAKLRTSDTPHIVAVNEIENRGDRVLKQALADLFHSDSQPIEVIKWKEIYDYLEEALDCCEDVVHTIEAALVKNS
jgi:uncharacterized protein Yka (UPF0111/DUF47 family)